ncbi:MAG: hypothetical protein ACXVRD_06650 [Gaiellaceae bacterium]
MGSKGLRFVVLALAGALALTGLAAAGSTQNSGKRTYKFLVIGKVVGGEQSYQRDPYPNESYTLGGSDTSTWIFRWHVKVVFQQGGMVYSPVANAFSMVGSAKGEYHGGYPRTNQPPAFYQCNWGPLAPKDVAAKLQFYVTGEATRSVAMLFGVQTEPGTLPNATCTGDAVDPLVSTFVSGGVFTGIEHGCGNTFAKLKIPAKRFRQKKQFAFKLKFHWGPQSPAGQSRSCNGFGDPVLSGGAGTWQFHFRREK